MSELKAGILFLVALAAAQAQVYPGGGYRVAAIRVEAIRGSIPIRAAARPSPASPFRGEAIRSHPRMLPSPSPISAAS